MGSRASSVLAMALCFFGLSLGSVSTEKVDSIEGTIIVNGKVGIGKTDEDFICATLDWWPPTKCDYGTCPWGQASLLNLDLSNKLFTNAIKAFSPLKLRLGGTLQDKLYYGTEDYKKPCTPFVRNTSMMFDFTEGCLPMKRWDELNSFFNSTGATIIFGLNALAGRTLQSDNTSTGTWDYSNAESFISYTVQKNYDIYAWELGNELCGTGVGTKVAASQYAIDTNALHSIVQKIYSGVEPKPLIISPGGFFEESWFKEFLAKAVNSMDVITHHIYDLGPGVDPQVINHILNSTYLDGEADTFKSLHDTLNGSPSSAVSWVGESGGAYNSGRNLTSNAFVYSFWYLDQLGMSAAFDTKTYCRQSLIGGNYGLLDTNTFVPNPDYYSALLWHQVMGRTSLSTRFSGTKKIRAYTHCAKQSKGITVLLINLDETATVVSEVDFNGTWSSDHHSHREIGSYDRRGGHFRFPRFESVTEREEYHLTAQGGDLHSRTMLLNGKALTVDSSGNIPAMDPIKVRSTAPIVVRPNSIVFAHVPYFTVPACQ